MFAQIRAVRLAFIITLGATTVLLALGATTALLALGATTALLALGATSALLALGATSALLALGATTAMLALGATSAMAAGLNQESPDPLAPLYEASRAGVEISGALRRPTQGLSDAQNGYGWTGSTTSGANPPRFGGSISARASAFDNADCMVLAHQPYGRWERRDTGWAAANDFAESRLETIGGDAACSWRFALGETTGLRVIGGVRAGVLEIYHQLGLPAHLVFHMNSDEIAFGWRAGLAYDDEATGLRISALYTAPMRFSLDGDHYVNGTRQTGSLTGDVTMPRSVALRAERDLAPGWRGAIDAEWAEWGAFDAMRVRGDALQGQGGAASFATGFKDTLSFGASVEHDLSPAWQAGVSARWDQGAGGAITDLVTLRAMVARRIGAQSLIELSSSIGWQLPGETSGIDAVTSRSWSYRSQSGPTYGAGARLVLGF
jgi:long-subunit fatty acid transport protein